MLSYGNVGLLEVIAGRGEHEPLDRAALELAQVEFGEFDPQPYLGILDSHARELGHRLAARANGFDFVQAANAYLFEELGFTGNTRDYYDPRNSCLNHALTARTGLPITLSVVYLEIARRLDRPVQGVNQPGHFVVQYNDGRYRAAIDPFHGRILEDAPAARAAATRREILVRMVHNLRGVYLRRRLFRKALQLADLLIEGGAGGPAEYKQRGLLRLQMRDTRAGVADLEKYLALTPDAPDRAEIEEHLRRLNHFLARLN